MIDIRDSGLDSWAFATTWWSSTGWWSCPGWRSARAGEGFVRVSFAAAPETILEGLARLAETLHDLKARNPAPPKPGRRQPAGSQPSAKPSSSGGVRDTISSERPNVSTSSLSRDSASSSATSTVGPR